MNIRAKSETVVEDWWQETIYKFTYQKHIFKTWTQALNLSSLSLKNKGLEWEFLDWKVLILIAFFCNVRIPLIAFEF